MSYNGSTLTKEEWQQAEDACKDHEILHRVWDDFKKLHNGRAKSIIQTYDTYIKFIEASVSIACGGGNDESQEDDEEFDLAVGRDDPDYALKLAAFKMLKDKDDKSVERIKGMLSDLGKYPLIIQDLFDKLGHDDQDELSSNDRQSLMAQKQRSRDKQSDESIL